MAEEILFMRLFTRKNVAFLACLLACTAMLGCAAGNYGNQITHVEYYPSCYAPLEDLREADKDFNKTVVASAATGALLGALVGLLANGKPEGALVGAVAGGAVGAGVGYAGAKQQRIADDNQRMASYLRDIDGDISGLDRATAAARVARDCYDKEFKSAIAAYKAGRIKRPELQRRYDEIRNGCSEASYILGSVITTAYSKEKEYEEALREESKVTGQPLPVVKASSDTDRKTGTKPAAQPRKKRPAPPKEATLEEVAQSTRQLNEAKQSAKDEQEALKKMQEEMDGTLATLAA